MKHMTFAMAVGVMAEVVFAGAPVELKNAGFHQTDGKGGAVGWSHHPNWHAEKAGHNGSGALVWECASESEIKNGGPGQEVTLKPGKRYDFSAIIKADNLVTQRKSPYQGLTIYVEGYDAKGKWMFGDTARPAVAGTSSDWVKVEGVTREIPEGVDKAYFRVIAKRCISGRGAVDNMFLAERETVAVEGVFPHVYRRESTGGPVRFSASINSDVHENRIEDYAAKFTYVAAGGKRVTLDGKVVSPVEAVATLDTSLFALGTNDVVCTLFLRDKEIGSASVPFAHLAKPTPRRVYIDRHLRTIVDGKPFFPLGMIHWGNVTKENIERYAEGPFNCLDTRWRMPREHLDICHAKGLLVTCGVDNGFDHADEGRKWLTERVNALKDHPALMGWFVSDELPLSDLPMLKRRQGWMEALDPDHPTWYAQDVVREARHYLGVADVIGLDPYPIPTKPIGLVYSTECQAVTNTFGAVAKWMIPQAFGWGWLKRRETKGQRAPTQKEMANMGWQSIAGGANGLIFYAYQHLSEPHDDPEDAFEPAWARTKAMAEEFKKYVDVFLSVDPAPAASSSNGDVAVRTWRYKGDTYLLAVNCTTNAQAATLALSENVGRLVSCDFGSASKVDGKTMEVSLEPIGYRMVRLTGFAEMKAVLTVPHELDVLIRSGHIQGACCSEQGVYLSHQLGIDKIGWDGKLIKHIDAPAHLGDSAYANGKIYGAFVIRDKKMRKDGKQGLVRVWDENLNQLNEAWFDEALDGIAVLGDTIYVGVDRWGYPKHPLCCVKRLGLDLSDKGNVDIDLGYEIHYGVQTMATDGKDLFFGNYGGTSRVSADLKTSDRVHFSCSEGFGLVPKSVIGRDAKVFFVVRALGGNMQGWRKDPVNNPPRIRLDFHEFSGDDFKDITILRNDGAAGAGISSGEPSTALSRCYCSNPRLR